MVDEEQQDDQVQQPAFDAKSELQAMQEQLAEMNRQYQESMQAIVQTVQSQTQKSTSYEDEYLTDEQKQIRMLEAQIKDIQSNTSKQTAEMIRRERELDNTVVRLAREFPEIQADAAIQKAVVAEHNKLAKNLQDTAEGYELAVQRAVMKAGLTPKSKRQAAADDDFSSPGRKGGGGAAGQSKRKGKVDEKTLQFAALLGRDIEDPKVLEGLEKASERQKWLKYQ